MATGSNGDIPPLSTVSTRARHTIQLKDFLTPYAVTSGMNPYHPKDNPKGYINMATAVNRLMEEELETRLRKADAMQYDRQFQHYYQLFGTFQFRMALADFLSRHLCPGRTLSTENIVVLNGVASCLDALGHAICDPGDVLLTPTPVYTRIFSDFCERALVDVQPIITTQEKNQENLSFTYQPRDIENRIQELKAEGKNVKGIILVHPQNPLGDFYSKSFLLDVLQVCARHKLHVIVDEIYALSIFRDEESFVSFLALEPISPEPEKIHFVWGMTKDFGLAGFRAGVIHSTNQEVVNCLKKLSTYQCTASIVHHACAALLNDKEWCDDFFLPTNRRKLRDSYEKARSFLEEMGIEVREAKSGFFVWINLQPFLNEVTKEEELALFEDFFKQRLFVVPGSILYCANPGWFRLIFCVHPQDLEAGLEKLRSVIEVRRK
ncbi:hypothetical protein SK128_022016 [Halocaridina rubra]|uniref:Aminotransferase class I/classII large domain-containing protein n=1 Tax=Halocaridina rubra TaxID=373956 RepID=A0AAN8X2B2_HALRR